MGKQKSGVTKKYAAVKRMITPHDSRVQKPTLNPNLSEKLAKKKSDVVNNVANTPSSLFFSHNMSLGPPYHVLIDTNFINFSIQNKLDIMKSLMDCLYAKVGTHTKVHTCTTDRAPLFPMTLPHPMI